MGEPTSRRVRRVVKALGLAFLVAAALGFTYEQIGRRQDNRHRFRIGRAVDVGGYSLNIDCSGAGSPAVILESGGGGYRRVLTKSESEQLRQKLKTIWGANGYWYPLSKCDPQTNVIAFHQELWEQRDGTSLLLQAIQQRAIERCFLLLEGPVDYEIARSLVEPMYRGDESYVTSDFEWLVYSSHESSIAIAGWLADFFRKQWRDWEAVAYGGPFHTADLRGSWGMLKR